MGNSSSSNSSHADRRRPSTRTQSGPQSYGSSRRTAPMIPDNFSSLPQVTQALRFNGLESCNLILGIDFTKSNEWSGKRTFGGRSLHDLDEINQMNPYEQVIDIIGRTLRDFDDDNRIPCFGFGDELTGDHSVFTFSQNGHAEHGFSFCSIRQRYREIVPNVTMAGPTSFAPIINQAVDIVNKTGGFHILVIIADGQVTRSVDIPPNAVSKNEKETIDAILYASQFPLGIIMVGVGDGPWDAMIYFDNYLVNRKFDNFQFVEFHKIMSQYVNPQMRETQFALQALMEIPEQYRMIKQMGYLEKRPFHFVQNISPPHVEVFPPPQPPPQLGGVGGVGGGYHSHSSNQPYPTNPTHSQQQQSRPALSSQNSFGYAFNMASQPQITLQQRTAQEPPVGLYHQYNSGQGGTPGAPPISPSFSPPAPSTSIEQNNSRRSISTAGKMIVTDNGPPSDQRPAFLENRSMSQAEIDLAQLQEALLCCICEEKQKDTVFNCGHETCRTCADQLTACPTCRQIITIRIKRYG